MEKNKTSKLGIRIVTARQIWTLGIEGLAIFFLDLDLFSSTFVSSDFSSDVSSSSSTCSVSVVSSSFSGEDWSSALSFCSSGLESEVSSASVSSDKSDSCSSFVSSSAFLCRYSRFCFCHSDKVASSSRVFETSFLLASAWAFSLASWASSSAFFLKIFLISFLPLWQFLALSWLLFLILWHRFSLW